MRFGNFRLIFGCEILNNILLLSSSFNINHISFYRIISYLKFTLLQMS